METRKITIVSSKTQRKSVITTGAETLSQLKSALDEAGIDYEGMTFYEGTSRTEMKDNASVLPKDVLYKGNFTNELVFMLTNTNKKIKSGAMSRKEAFETIKSMGLANAVKAKYGKNYTMCTTASLIEMIQGGTTPTLELKVPAKEPKTKPVVAKPAEEVKPVEFIDKGARRAIIILVEALQDEGNIEDDLAKDMLNCFNNSNVEEDVEEDGGYSNKEIDDMFNFM